MEYFPGGLSLLKFPPFQLYESGGGVWRKSPHPRTSLKSWGQSKWHMGEEGWAWCGGPGQEALAPRDWLCLAPLGLVFGGGLLPASAWESLGTGGSVPQLCIAVLRTNELSKML